MYLSLISSKKKGCCLLLPFCFLAFQKIDILAQPNKLHIMATTTILADAVKRIVGEKATVGVLMSRYADPHNYEPTIKETQQLIKADIILCNGHHLEGMMQPILKSISKNKRLIIAMDGIPEAHLLFDKNHPQIKDPHFWMSVVRYIEVIKYITKRLEVYDPTHASFFKKNSLVYIAELRQLHHKIKKKLEIISKRVLVTAHDAYGYFEKSYQFKVYALQGLSTTAKFNLYTLNKLSRIIQEHQIKTIFLEDTVTHKNIYALQQNLSRKGYQIQIGSSLPSDALGAHKNYVAMMWYIASTLAKEL